MAAVSVSNKDGEEPAMSSLLLPTLQPVFFLCDNVVIAPFRTLSNV
jgi:hypothetical protein